jgi:hypothetical protein
MQVEVIDAETPAGMPANALLNVWDSCALEARGIRDSRFRWVEVTSVAGGSGAMKVGYRTADPKKVGSLTLPQVGDNSWYDLRHVVIKLGGLGDKAVIVAGR